jgi:hypothetical protein
MRHNGFFFPVLREFTGKKSHPAKFCPPKTLVYQIHIASAGRLADAGSGKFRQIIDGKIIDLMMQSIRFDLVAKMARPLNARRPMSG